MVRFADFCTAEIRPPGGRSHQTEPAHRPRLEELLDASVPDHQNARIGCGGEAEPVVAIVNVLQVGHRRC
jgi:hypothetical protein